MSQKIAIILSHKHIHFGCIIVKKMLLFHRYTVECFILITLAQDFIFCLTFPDVCLILWFHYNEILLWLYKIVFRPTTYCGNLARITFFSLDVLYLLATIIKQIVIHFQDFGLATVLVSSLNESRLFVFILMPYVDDFEMTFCHETYLSETFVNCLSKNGCRSWN